MTREIELDPEVTTLLDGWAKHPEPVTADLTATAVRESDLAVLALQRPPEALHAVDDVEAPGPAGPLRVRVYRPRNRRSRAVLFLHGGGFVIGSEGYDAPLRELALACDCIIVAPEIRLAPEYPYPAAVEDTVAVAQWLVPALQDLGAAPIQPGIAGDSSGGNLAAVATQVLARDRARPAFQVLLYPMLDATADSPSHKQFATGFGFSAAKARWYFDQYLPKGIDRRIPRVSPLLAPDVSDLPATFIVTAEADPLRNDGERYADRLREAGVDVDLRRYTGMIHGFWQMTGAITRADQVRHEIGTWIRAR